MLLRIMVSVIQILERMLFSTMSSLKKEEGTVRKEARLWHAEVTKSRETRFHSRKLGFTPDKLGFSRVN